MVRNDILRELLSTSRGEEVLELIENTISKIKIDASETTETDKLKMRKNLKALNDIASEKGFEPVYIEENSVEQDVRKYFIDLLRKDKHGLNL